MTCCTRTPTTPGGQPLSAANYELTVNKGTLTIDPMEALSYTFPDTKNYPEFDSETWIQANFGLDLTDEGKYRVEAAFATDSNNGGKDLGHVGARNLELLADGTVRFQAEEYTEWRKFVFVTIEVFEYGDLIARAEWWFLTQH